MRNALTLLGGCLLAACATPADVTKASMNPALDALIGQPASQAIAMLGEPESRTAWEGQTLMAWSRDTLERRQVTIISSDFRNRTMPAAATRRFREWHWCEVYLVVSPEDEVTGWRYRGTPHGCDGYDGQLAFAK